MQNKNQIPAQMKWLAVSVACMLLKLMIDVSSRILGSDPLFSPQDACSWGKAHLGIKPNFLSAE